MASKNLGIDVDIKAAGYENVYFDCPVCGKENILNRVTDLKDDLPLSRLQGVICKNDRCKQKINLVGDSVTSAKYQWFMHELYIFIERKEYRSYILSLCQGVEAFFYQAIINQKFDRNPDYRSELGGVDLSLYNPQRRAYDEQILGYTFKPMRNEFLKTFKFEISNYAPIGRKPGEDKRIKVFKIIENTDIHNLRNQVVHKHAYRPTLEDIERYNILVDAIYWAGLYLNVQDSVSILNHRLTS